jgi:hypothetical protein
LVSLVSGPAHMPIVGCAHSECRIKVKNPDSPAMRRVRARTW